MLESIDPEQPALVSQRSIAFREALASAGIPVDEDLIVQTDWGGENGAAAMGELLGCDRLPTAVFAHSDDLALGAIRTLRRVGLRVPEDISIVGIDDHPAAALADLTTVRQDPFEQGRRSAQMVLSILAGSESEPGAELVPTTLIVRGTTAQYIDPTGE